MVFEKDDATVNLEDNEGCHLQILMWSTCIGL